MATTGTNYTAKWELVDGVLTISPVSGDSGEMRGEWAVLAGDPYIKKVVDMTDEEWLSVTYIVFIGSIQIKRKTLLYGNPYEPYVVALFSQGHIGTSIGDRSLSNVISIDVSGLNTTGCTSFSYTFQDLTSLVEIIGLDTLDTSSIDNYSYMFDGTHLSELDLSSFSNMNTAEITGMFSGMYYLESVILPNNFSRTSSYLNNKETTVYFIGMANSAIYATNSQTQVTVTSDEDFFALETGQGGTWIRDISGSASLSFKIRSVQRDGNNVTVSYSYATSTATIYMYLKESSASSFPQTPTETIVITGSGTGSTTLALTSDSAYEIQSVVTDGETNIYTFTSIDSNVLLLSLSDSGSLQVASDIVAGGDMTVNENLYLDGTLTSFIDWDGTSIPASDKIKTIYVRPSDNYNEWVGCFGSQVYTTASGQRKAGGMGSFIGARHPDANVNNYIIAYVNPDGTRGYSVTDPALFRSAIGLGGVGTRYSANKNVNTTANADSYAAGASITIPAGTYILIAYGSFPSTSTNGVVRVQLYNNTAGAIVATKGAYGSGWLSDQIIWTVAPSASTTYSTRLSSSVARTNATTYCMAIRII